MTNTSLEWVANQLTKRHPDRQFQTGDGDRILINLKPIRVPIDELRSQVNERTHYNDIEAEMDLLFTLLFYVEAAAGLKSPYER